MTQGSFLFADFPIIAALILLPLLAGLMAFCARGRHRLVRFTLLLGAATHTLLTGMLFFAGRDQDPIYKVTSQWLAFDDVGGIFLALTSLLFLAVSIHTACWLPRETEISNRHDPSGASQMRDHTFCACLLGFLSMMTLVLASRNFGLLWVAVEATTLASAPLICFHKGARSLEAMWKYLLICSVGIALALFGTLLLTLAAQNLPSATLGMDSLSFHMERLHPGWFKAAFIFILAGYGTKMGLAPFHTWLPDAHSEAPGTVSALLSGSLLNCSFVAIFRFLNLSPASLRPFCNDLMLALGLISLAVSAFFIIRQTDFKRMLAYSSVEHMGLAAIFLGLGLGSEPLAVLHLCGHSFIKVALFLVAGNILMAYGTRSIADVGGMLGTIPRNAVLWLIGLMLIGGTPPSPLFVTEFLLVTSAPLWLGVTVLAVLFAVFCGMASGFLKMAMGKGGVLKTTDFPARQAERLWFIPALLFLSAVLAGSYLIFSYELMNFWMKS